MLDEDSGLTFCLQTKENNKIQLNTEYNKIKVDVRHYDLTVNSLKVLKKLIDRAIKDA